MRPTWPKSETILNTHPISVHTKFDMDCMHNISDNGRKPHFSVILWQLQGQNLANVDKGESFLNINPKSADTKFELHCMNTF